MRKNFMFCLILAIASVQNTFLSIDCLVEKHVSRYLKFYLNRFNRPFPISDGHLTPADTVNKPYFPCSSWRASATITRVRHVDESCSFRLVRLVRSSVVCLRGLQPVIFTLSN